MSKKKRELSDLPVERPVIYWGGRLDPTRQRRNARAFTETFALIFLATALICFCAFASIRFMDPLPLSPLETLKALAILFVHSLLPMLWPDKSPYYAMHLVPYAFSLGWRVGSALVAGGFLGYFGAISELQISDGYTHLSGGRRFTGLAALPAARKNIAPGDSIPIHPSVPMSDSAWGPGAILFGPAGIGKTTILMPWLEACIASGARFLATDVKGDLTAGLKDIEIFAPWDSRSLCWAIAKDIRTPDECDSLAAVLAPVGGDNNKIWQEAAQAVVSGHLKHLLRVKPGKWDFTDLEEIQKAPVERWHEILCEVAPSQAKLLEGAKETVASVAFNVTIAMRNLARIAELFRAVSKAQGGKPKMISFREWARGTSKIRRVVIRYNEENSAIVGFLAPFIIDFVATQIAGLPEKRGGDPAVIALEEIAQFPKIQRLVRFLEIGRSKGFRVLMTVQDYSQLQKIYEKDAQNLQVNAHVQIFCRAGTSEGLRIQAEMMGTRTVTYLSETTTISGGQASTTRQTVKETLPLYTPSEMQTRLGVGSFGKGRSGARAVWKGIDGNCYELDWPFVNQATIRPVESPLLLARPGVLNAAFHLRTSKPISEKIKAIKSDKDCRGLRSADFLELLIDHGAVQLPADQSQERTAREWITFFSMPAPTPATGASEATATAPGATPLESAAEGNEAAEKTIEHAFEHAAEAVAKTMMPAGGAEHLAEIFEIMGSLAEVEGHAAPLARAKNGAEPQPKIIPGAPATPPPAQPDGMGGIRTR